MHLDWPFWALVVGAGVWLQVSPVRRTTAFGLANLGALVVLFGTDVAAAAPGQAVLLWVLLRIAKEGTGWVVAGKGSSRTLKCRSSGGAGTMR